MNAWAEGRLDKTFQLLCEADPSVQKARLLIPLVDALQSLDAESELSETLAGLDGPERQKLVQKNSICRRLVESAGPPSNWAAWFEGVKEGRYASVEQALTYAEKLAEEWHPKQLLGASSALERLTTSIENAPLGGEAGRTISRALPSLLRALQNDPKYPRSTFQGALPGGPDAYSLRRRPDEERSRCLPRPLGDSIGARRFERRVSRHHKWRDGALEYGRVGPPNRLAPGLR